MNQQQIRPLKETGEHSYHRRAISHDYYAPFIYHIIMKKAQCCEAFGVLEGEANIAPGKPGCASINESKLGKIISKAIVHLHYEYPVIKIHQFCVMPDHAHILLEVLFRYGKHLDFYIDHLKAKITARYSRETGRKLSEDDIFQPGYCDKPLYINKSLDGLYRYIRENPHRLAMRRQFPQFFQRIRKLKIEDQEYEAYGNLFLFRNPDKFAVKISRKFSEKEKLQKSSQWLEAVSKGAVPVSPFIAPAEKAIQKKAEDLGAGIILITHQAFPDRFKPAAHDFSLCSSGRLLIITLGLPFGTPLSRSICNKMNNLAQTIAEL